MQDTRQELVDSETNMTERKGRGISDTLSLCGGFWIGLASVRGGFLGRLGFGLASVWAWLCLVWD